MRMLRRICFVVSFLCSMLLWTPSSALAVVGGTPDTANEFQNVGVLQLQFQGEWFQLCSGTLVADGVVLTSAHCVDFLQEVGDDGFGPDDLRVSFDPQPDDSSTYYAPDHIVTNPDWFTAGPCLGNSKMLCLAPPAEDIALIFLEDSVAGVTPASLPGPGYLDEFNPKTLSLTVVGYGVDGFQTGTIISPHAVILDDGTRSYRDVSLIPATDVFPDRFFKFTKSTCFGDSGGPIFHGDVVVGLNAWTFSYRCDGPNFGYRTDSAPAQEFLDTYL